MPLHPVLRCAGVTLDTHERQLLAQFLGVAIVRGQRGTPARTVGRNVFSLRVQRGRRGPEVDLGSILRTEAVRSFPEPEREIISMRDIDTGAERRELSGPARERAHSEGK